MDFKFYASFNGHRSEVEASLGFGPDSYVTAPPWPIFVGDTFNLEEWVSEDHHLYWNFPKKFQVIARYGDILGVRLS